MDDNELKELRNPENWEVDGDPRPPIKAPRAIVSVAFSREDYENVVEAAKNQGAKTSEFIRRAALDAIGQQRASDRAPQLVSASGFVSSYPTNVVRASLSRVVLNEDPAPKTFSTV